MSNHSYNKILNMWLKNIKDVYRFHKTELDTHTTEESKFDRLVELNVQEQVLQLSKTSIIQKAWQNEQRPHLHGWVYGLKDGIIKPVFEMEACSEIDPLYKYDDL
jgi:carbonic anhydrase